MFVGMKCIHKKKGRRKGYDLEWWDEGQSEAQETLAL
jgi:hypothetical protein